MRNATCIACTIRTSPLAFRSSTFLSTECDPFAQNYAARRISRNVCCNLEIEGDFNHPIFNHFGNAFIAHFVLNNLTFSFTLLNCNYTRKHFPSTKSPTMHKTQCIFPTIRFDSWICLRLVTISSLFFVSVNFDRAYHYFCFSALVAFDRNDNDERTKRKKEQKW